MAFAAKVFTLQARCTIHYRLFLPLKFDFFWVDLINILCLYWFTVSQQSYGATPYSIQAQPGPQTGHFQPDGWPGGGQPPTPWQVQRIPVYNSDRGERSRVVLFGSNPKQKKTCRFGKICLNSVNLQVRYAFCFIL